MGTIPTACAKCPLHTRAGYFCSVLSADELEHLSSVSTRQAIQPGDSLTETFLDSWPVFGIADGVLGVRRHDADGRATIAAFLVPGDIVDLRGAPSEMLSSLSALTEVRVCYLEPRAFEAVLEKNAAARKIAWTSLQQQSFRMIEQTAALSKKRASEKLAWFICTFRHMHGRDIQVSQSAEVFRNPFRNIDLADYLGIRPETVSRAFRSLEEAGAIKVHRSNLIQVIDRNLLLVLASASSLSADSPAEFDNIRVLLPTGS